MTPPGSRVSCETEKGQVRGEGGGSHWERQRQPLLEPGEGSRRRGHLGLSTRGVIGEQVASWWDLGLNPSEQSCAGGHFLGLQIPRALQPWEEKGKKRWR